MANSNGPIPEYSGVLDWGSGPGYHVLWDGDEEKRYVNDATWELYKGDVGVLWSFAWTRAQLEQAMKVEQGW